MRARVGEAEALALGGAGRSPGRGAKTAEINESVCSQSTPCTAIDPSRLRLATEHTFRTSSNLHVRPAGTLLAPVRACRVDFGSSTGAGEVSPAAAGASGAAAADAGGGMSSQLVAAVKDCFTCSDLNNVSIYQPFKVRNAWSMNRCRHTR